MALPVRVERGRAADPFELARNDFNTMINRLFGDDQESGLASIGNFGVDIREEPDRIIVEADLPGFRKEDVDITLENGTLTIVAQRTEETEEPRGGNGGRTAQQGQAQQQPQGQAQQAAQQPSAQAGQATQQRGGQQQRQSHQAGQYLLRERRMRRMVRSFTLPTNVNEQNVEARLDNGVLRIILHKTEEAKPQRVQIA